MRRRRRLWRRRSGGGGAARRGATAAAAARRDGNGAGVLAERAVCSHSACGVAAGHARILLSTGEMCLAVCR